MLSLDSDLTDAQTLRAAALVLERRSPKCSNGRPSWDVRIGLNVLRNLARDLENR